MTMEGSSVPCSVSGTTAPVSACAIQPNLLFNQTVGGNIALPETNVAASVYGPQIVLSPNTCSTPNFNPTTTCVASLLATQSKQRAESFMLDEVKVLLEEIAKRKLILLSLSPSTNRLKRRAWEEVAVSMANRWPHSPRRTADQVKKKWENLVSKTKRKIRAGHVTPDLEWSEANSIVMEFLAQHSPLLQTRYALARSMVEPPSRPFSCNSFGTEIALNRNGFPQVPSAPKCPTPSESVQQAEICQSKEEDIKPSLPIIRTGPTEETPTGQPNCNEDSISQTAVCQNESCTASASAVNPFNTTLAECSAAAGISCDLLRNLTQPSIALPFSMPGTVLNQAPMESFTLHCPSSVTTSSSLDNVIVQESLKEFAIRRDILQLQKRAWELQVQLLQEAVDSKRLCHPAGAGIRSGANVSNEHNESSIISSLENSRQ